jgi:hypothetical protein
MQERDPGRFAEAKGMAESEVEAGANGGAPGALARADLRDQVTVFVTTVGAPTFEACLAHLRQQDCEFGIEIIDHVAPMAAAFQRMIDHCRTPFYVQVDEDMLLRPHAIRALYQHIQAAPAEVAEVVGLLFDVHVQRPIEGVKIFRHAIVRHYPFENLDGCDVRQLRRLEDDGFKVIRRSRVAQPPITAISREIMGLHGTAYTKRSIYERYLSYWLKCRRGTIQPRSAREDAHRFLDRMLDEPSELNLFALMGLVAAHLIDAESLLGEKDYRTYTELPGYDALCNLLQECRRGFAMPCTAWDDSRRSQDEERTPFTDHQKTPQ